MTASLYLSEAPNEADLAAVLGKLAIRCPLPHGDVAFFGVWEFDHPFAGLSNPPQPTVAVEPIRVCVERKRIRDMMNAIITGRYMHQVQAAKEAGFDRLIVVVEGEVQPDPKTGYLQTRHSPAPYTPAVPTKIGNARVVGSIAPKVPKSWKSTAGKWYTPDPPMPYHRWDEYLSELELYMGIMVKRSQNVQETAAIVRALWSLFQRPPSEHSSLEKFYQQPPPRADLFSRPSFLRRVAKEIDGIGWDKSIEVARRFRSVSEMCAATAKDWRKIPGIGPKTASRAVEQLNAGNSSDSSDSEGVIDGNSDQPSPDTD